ncbi:hypothetical protein [cyanobacterium endosymbiont of Rhopalodia gibberula]|uniref:hypothetical protein n=1 Tax=cyanobacterium endosymbiont of Rhopalodia gibberula TaxID=1763363 RepID=UPI001E35CA34|nr:hypothetical protein [cyanobacterium endosymbiont of Rhopalodia gibberula]
MADDQFGVVFNTISFLCYFNSQAVSAEVSRVLLLQEPFYIVDSNVGPVRFISLFLGKINFYSH